MKRVLTLLAIPFLLAFAGVAETRAQTLYGVDPFFGLVFEFSMPPGGACAAPDVVDAAWLYTFPATCGGAPPAPTPTGGPFNAIAVNRVTDTILVSDGFVIEEYAAGSPAGPAAGAPLSAFSLASIPLTGPVLGMCVDGAGSLLYLTDGSTIVGLDLAAGPCVVPAVVVPRFFHGMGAGVVLTDIDFDPVTGGGTLWACGVAGGLGVVYNIVPGTGGLGPGGAFSSIFTTPVGIAFDGATPVSAPLVARAPHVYLTDGATVAYIDTSTGNPSVTQPFYTPITFAATPGSISGLAWAAHGVQYGNPPATFRVGSAGQSTSPGPTFMLTVRDAPVPGFLWVVSSFSFPGPGFVCPPVWALFNPFYVSTAPPAVVFGLIGTSLGTMTIPAPVPAGMPTGLNVFVQFFTDLSPVGPGGPWLSTQGLQFAISAP